MSADPRARYLHQRVMTATPGQRVVMLYDRLALDLTRADDALGQTVPDVYSARQHVDHAMQIVAELAGSLRHENGGPADNLASIYNYLLGELTAVRGGATARLAGARDIVGTLRDAWATAVTSTMAPAAAGAWVG